MHTLAGRPRAALYLRLSVSRDDSTSIARQEQDLRAEAQRQGWEVRAVAADDGVSGRKDRDALAGLIGDLRDDRIDVIAVWKLDRFSRQGMGALVTLMDVLDEREKSGRPALFYALRDGLRSDQPMWRMVAGLLSEVARSEAESIAARVSSSIAYRTAQGKFTGLGGVPFGYRSVPAPDGVGRVLAPDPEEAAVVAEVTERLLAGAEPIRRIARDLEDRGIPAARSPYRRALLAGEDPTGLDKGSWSASQIRARFSSPSLLGQVVRNGEVVRDEDGHPVAAWPPLVSAEQWLGLQARWAATPDRRRGRQRSRLLSQILVCASCGAPLSVSDDSQREPIYRCVTPWRDYRPGTCDAPVTVRAARIENYVTAAVLAICGGWPELTRVQLAATTTGARLAEVEAEIDRVARSLVRDDVDPSEAAGRLLALRARREELRAAAATEEPPEVWAETGRTIAEAWEATEDVHQRRGVVALAVKEVRLGRSPRSGQALLEDRTEIIWTS